MRRVKPRCGAPGLSHDLECALVHADHRDHPGDRLTRLACIVEADDEIIGEEVGTLELEHERPVALQEAVPVVVDQHVWILNPVPASLIDLVEIRHSVCLGPDERRTQLPVVGQPLLDTDDQSAVFLFVLGRVDQSEKIILDRSRLVIDRDGLLAVLVIVSYWLPLRCGIPPGIKRRRAGGRGCS